MATWTGRQRETAARRTTEREMVAAGVDLRKPLEPEWDFLAPANGLLKVTGTLVPDQITAWRSWMRRNKPRRVRWAGLVHPVRRTAVDRRFPLYLTIPLDEAAAMLARLEFLEQERARWLDA